MTSIHNTPTSDRYDRKWPSPAKLKAVNKMNIKLPKHLQTDHVSRGQPRRPPPIPFVPSKEDVVTGTSSDSLRTIKMKTGNRMYETMTEFSGGTPESFVQYAMTIEQMVTKKELHALFAGYETKHRDALEAMDVEVTLKPPRWLPASESSESAEGVETSSDDDEDGQQEAPEDNEVHQEDMSPVVTNDSPEPKASTKKKKSKEAPIPRKRKSPLYKKWKETYALLEDKRMNAAKGMNDTMVEVFNTWRRVLNDAQRFVWESIVTKVCDSPEVSTTSGVSSAPGYTWATLELVKREWMLQVFRDDAAEEMRIYMQFFLKFAQGRISIRTFFARMEQLNTYLPYLPCLKDSAIAGKHTVRSNVAFSEHELAVLILRSMPRAYEDHFWLSSEYQPQELIPLRNRLEAIAAVVSPPAHSSGHSSQKKRGRLNDHTNASDKKHKGSGGGRGGKSGAANGGNGRKYCTLCEKYGGAKDTHSTAQCLKYDSQGKRLASFDKSRGERAGAAKTAYVNNRRRGDKHAYAQSISAAVGETVSKAIKESMRKKRKKHSRRESNYDSTSSDSE